MLSFSKNILKLQTNTMFLIRHISNTKTNSLSSVETAYTENDSDKILHTLNTSDPQDLLKLKMPFLQVKKLMKWRSEKGSFKSLVDVLEVDGMGDNMLKKIFDNIKMMDYSKLQMSTKKSLKNIITPEIKASMIYDLQSAVAIHVDSVGISWARLAKNNNTLTHWQYENFRNLPEKLSLAEIFQLAVHFVNITPQADVYIFEALPILSIQNKSKPLSVSSHNQQMELLSMLLALLNTSKLHNKDLCVDTPDDSKTKIENKVFFMKSYIPARLFKTFIGSEKVSSIVAVSEFLIPTFQKTVNLCCTAVSLGHNLKEMYMKQSSINKELLSQSVMLGCAFMDLCIYKNKDTVGALQAGRKKSK